MISTRDTLCCEHPRRVANSFWVRPTSRRNCSSACFLIPSGLHTAAACAIQFLWVLGFFVLRGVEGSCSVGVVGVKRRALQSVGRGNPKPKGSNMHRHNHAITIFRERHKVLSLCIEIILGAIAATLAVGTIAALLWFADWMVS